MLTQTNKERLNYSDNDSSSTYQGDNLFFVMLTDFPILIFGILHVVDATDDIGKKSGIYLVIVGVLFILIGVAGYYIGDIVGRCNIRRIVKYLHI